ncbi:TonB-dependent receptor [Brevundimonas sp.]|uniref:TonB-dependent receptor n=1 Tax=Brevundimonas sp. TaxID=1871086 RepID=UPI0022BC96BA|nr:TonB-dependent receptor [Brevundimonas sp.]MCZ8194817.1 TonB-dependent receptor [Brevundimonas sp.]
MQARYLVCASAAALAVAGNVQAQAGQSGAPTTTQQITQLEEVVVTARKREEQIIDVPASVSAFSREQAEELGGIPDIKSLSYVVPGLALVDTGNINQEVNIRGAGAGTARVTGVNSPIAVLRNGANVAGGNIGGRTYTRTDLFDIERIEVVRGPQGSLYGVNAVGGVMNLISRRPQRDFGFRGSAGWTNEIEASAFEAVLNLPVGDHLAFRVGGQLSDAEGGHFINVSDGKPGDVAHYRGLRASALWEPTDEVSIYLVADSSTDESTSNRIRTTYVLNDPTSTAGPNDPDGPYRYGHNTSNLVTRDLTNYLAQIEWSTPLGEITSVTAHRDRGTRFFQDEDGSFPGYAQLPFPGPPCFTRSCVTLFTDDTVIFSQEFRISNSFGDHIDWIAGVNWQRVENEFAFISDGRTNNNAATLSPTGNNAAVFRDDESQIGVFASASWAASDRLTVDGAIRWGRTEKEGDAYNVRRGTGSVFCNYLDPFNSNVDATCISLPIAFSETYENVAPSLAVKYALAENFNVFATVARGYRSGGFNGTAVSFPTTVPVSYDEEETTAYEAGAKVRVGGGLLTITAFRNDFNDLLVSLPIPGDTAGRSYRENAGEAETHGVDLEWVGRAEFFPEEWGRLDMTAGLNWLDGEITSGPYQGRTVEGAPEHTYTATAIYTRRIGNGMRLSASTSYRGQRGGFTNTTRINNLVPLDDLDLWNARLALDVDQLQFSLSASNLFDEQYVALKDPNRSVYGNPREITFRVLYRFGSEAPRRR